MVKTWQERLFERVLVCETGCLLWTGSINSNGYSQMLIKGHMKRPHRLAYEMVFGPIPPGKVLDHLCRVRHCVNPRHLEAVTHRVNILRGNGASAVHAKQTHCIRGHAFDERNTKITTEGWRHCRKCDALDRAKRRKAERAKNPVAARTHCIRGHLLAGENLYIKRRGTRECRMCRSSWPSRKSLRAEARP